MKRETQSGLELDGPYVRVDRGWRVALCLHDPDYGEMAGNPLSDYQGYIPEIPLVPCPGGNHEPLTFDISNYDGLVNAHVFVRGRYTWGYRYMDPGDEDWTFDCSFGDECITTEEWVTCISVCNSRVKRDAR